MIDIARGNAAALADFANAMKSSTSRL